MCAPWKTYLECEWRVCVSFTDALVPVLFMLYCMSFSYFLDDGACLSSNKRLVYVCGLLPAVGYQLWKLYACQIRFRATVQNDSMHNYTVFQKHMTTSSTINELELSVYKFFLAHLVLRVYFIFPPHLLVQLLYLGKLSRPKYPEFSFKLLIFPTLYYDIKWKTVTLLFYLPIIQLTVYQRTITRFIADDKVVYQGVRWATRLSSGNSWAGRPLKHLNWRSRWIILICTLNG